MDRKKNNILSKRITSLIHEETQINTLDIMLIHKFFHSMVLEGLKYNQQFEIDGVLSIKVFKHYRKSNKEYSYRMKVLFSPNYIPYYTKYLITGDPKDKVIINPGTTISKWVVDNIKIKAGVKEKTISIVVCKLFEHIYLKYKRNDKNYYGDIKFTPKLQINRSGQIPKDKFPQIGYLVISYMERKNRDFMTRIMNELKEKRLR